MELGSASAVGSPRASSETHGTAVAVLELPAFLLLLLLLLLPLVVAFEVKYIPAYYRAVPCVTLDAVS